MKRGIAVLLSVSALLVVGYFTASKWAIRHQSITFYDAERDNRPVAVDIAVRRDREMQADAGMLKLPVAIFNHGNTVKNTEYSFLANMLAARGYMVISIQHDLPTDAPMVTKVGEIFVGRLTQIQRGVANIKFAVQQMREVEPNADYDHLTVVGHSMGGDITMYFAKQYPDVVKKVVTLDNLRVPFITAGKFKILSFRSKDPQFKTDPGVIPSADECEKAGITVVNTTSSTTTCATPDRKRPRPRSRACWTSSSTPTDNSRRCTGRSEDAERHRRSRTCSGLCADRQRTPGRRRP